MRYRLHRFYLPIALIAGASTLFSFAPYSYWPIQIASLAVLFYLTMQAQSIRQSLGIGWMYGFGWSLCGVYWLYVSMHHYGGLAAPVAALAVILMAIVLGLFPAIVSATGYWLAKRWPATSIQTNLLIFPALWALTEWLRGWFLTGFPWVVSGYAHTTSPLSGFAPVVGVYGIGLLAAMLAGCLVLLFHSRQSHRWAVTILLVSILATGNLLRLISWTSPAGSPIHVRLLQGNVPQEMKFSPDKIEATLQQYRQLIEMKPADLIVTPETAIPIYLHQVPEQHLKKLIQFSAQTNSNLAIGVPYADPRPFHANSVIVINPEQQKTPKEALIKPASGMKSEARRAQDMRHTTETGGVSSTEQRSYSPVYRYDKHHLVPFGEFIPPGTRWFINLMQIPLGDFNRGALLQPPFAVKNQWVLPNICYEDLFGEEIAAQIAYGKKQGIEPTILLNLSNIAWFGNTHALPQHLQISQMRALETRRPMLRATNTGATAVIDEQGQVLDQLPYYTEGTLSFTVQGYEGLTPYIRFGNLPVLGLSLLLLILARLRANRTRRISRFR